MSQLFPPNYLQIKENFLKELILASQGQSSSIAFIKHKFHNHAYSFKTIQAIVIGGTNFTTALAILTKKSTVREMSGNTPTL